MRVEPRPDAARLHADFEHLAGFRDPNLPGWTRSSFTAVYAQAREWLAHQMAAAGLSVSIDAGGNLVGRLPGTRPERPPILVGSHTDTVVGGGRFDGVAGVLAGIELARCLNEGGGQGLAHPLEIVDFLAEEPTEFGLSTIGSRAMVGALDEGMLRRTNSSGQTLAAAINKMGGRAEALGWDHRKPGDVALYLELHIEQGPVLEREDLRVGLVTGITGIHRLRATLTGRPDHAGTTPMSLRRDALAGAAEAVLALESICQGGEVVGTIGVMNVNPGASNVVPGQVTLTAEMRSVSASVLAERWPAFQQRLRQIAERRSLGLDSEVVSTEEPVVIPESILALLTASCEHLDLPARRLPSGAGHDANQLAKIAPVGMVFVPCKEGRSHCPEEWASAEDVALGLHVLAGALLAFDDAHRL
ncbi:MAG: allantoate amidohydrolase [Chloroflexota bacterium]